MNDLNKKLEGEELAKYLAERFPKQLVESVEIDDEEEEEEEEEFELISEWEAQERYDQMLDECYPEVEICGYKWDPSTALKRIDEIAYNCGFSDYVSSLESDGIRVEGY